MNFFEEEIQEQRVQPFKIRYYRIRSKNSLSSLCTALFADIAGRTTVSSKLLFGIPCNVVESGGERAAINSEEANFASSDLIRPPTQSGLACFHSNSVYNVLRVSSFRHPQAFNSPVCKDLGS